MILRKSLMLAVLFAGFFCAPGARADEPREARGEAAPVYIHMKVKDIEPIDVPDMVSGFMCEGEPKSATSGLSTKEIRMERDKRIQELKEGKVPKNRIAHYHCVIAEIMTYLGDLRAEAYYKRAIALHPKEPAYELFYARYLQGRRGAAGPLTENAERHQYRALEKLKSFDGVGQAGSTNEVARDWSQRGLYNLYLTDGLPLLPVSWKAYPYKQDASKKPQAFLGVFLGVAKDTNDFWELADSRKFTGELTVYRDRTAADATVSDAEREQVAEEIPRAPLRWDGEARLRVRQNALGAVDLSARRTRFFDSQVTNLAEPLERNDINLQQVGFGWQRAFNLKEFDMKLQAGVSRQWRQGIVEHAPEDVEVVHILQANPTVSRFIGPDKLTIGGTYVYFDTPNVTDAPVDEQTRERVVRGLFVDYALYRPYVAPQLGKGTWVGQRKRHRGWHFFGAVMINDETFGQTVIKKTDLTAGTAFKGLGKMNILLSGTRYSSQTIISQGNEAGTAFERVVEKDQSQSQYRTNLVLSRWLVDPDETPGMPKTVQSLSVTMPLRHDIALTGPSEYENVRGGLHLWALLSAKGLRGTAFLLDAGVDYQNFYNVGRGLFLAALNLRMGLPEMGNIPAYN